MLFSFLPFSPPNTGIAVESLFYYSRDPDREGRGRYCGEDTLPLFDINIRPSGIPLKFASLRALMPWICPIFSRYRGRRTILGSASFQDVRRIRSKVYIFLFFLHFNFSLLYHAHPINVLLCSLRNNKRNK